MLTLGLLEHPVRLLDLLGPELIFFFELFLRGG